MTEASLTGEAKRFLTGQGVLIFKTNDNFTSGIPDTYTLYENGVQTWLEFKLSQDGTPIPDMARRKKLQLHTMRDIRMRGAFAYYPGYVLTDKKLTLELWDPLDIEVNSELILKPKAVAEGRGHELLLEIVTGRHALRL